VSETNLPVARKRASMADDGMSRLWWAVSAVGMTGLIVLNLTAPERVFGIPAGQFQMLYMATFVFLLALVSIPEDKRVRALGLSIMAIGFLTRAGQPTVGERISLVVSLACIVVGATVMILGQALVDSRATPSA
jgi:hypothetical protein